MTILASVILLGEHLTIEMIGFATAVIACVIMGNYRSGKNRVGMSSS